MYSLPLLIGILEGSHIFEVNRTAGVACKSATIAFAFLPLDATTSAFLPFADTELAFPMAALAQDVDSSATDASPGYDCIGCY